MKTMLEFLKVNFKWLVILTVFLLSFLQIRSCRDNPLYDEISVLKGKLVEREAALLDKDKVIEGMTKAHDEKIAELMGHLDSSSTVIANLEGKEKELTEKTKDLELAEATITDREELIGNLRGQIETWRSRFTLAEQTIAEKDKVIFSLTEMYESENKLRLEIATDRHYWKTQYFDQKELTLKLETKIGNQDKLSTFQKVGIVVLSGVVAYAILRK